MAMYGAETSVAVDLDLHVARGVRRGQQQRAEVLAGDVAAHPRAAAREPAGPHDHGGAPVAGLALGVDAEGPEAVEQRLDRALAHGRRAVDDEGAVAERDRRGEKARGRPRVADLERGRGRGQAAIDAVDDERACGGVGLHPHAERLQRPVHVARVVGEERVA